MTKQAMILEVFSACNWSERTIEKNLKYALRHNKANVERIYNAFLSDRENARFYSAILAA